MGGCRAEAGSGARACGWLGRLRHAAQHAPVLTTPHLPTRPLNLQDIGLDPNAPTTRLYATSAPQPIHNDGEQRRTGWLCMDGNCCITMTAAPPRQLMFSLLPLLPSRRPRRRGHPAVPQPGQGGRR